MIPEHIDSQVLKLRLEHLQSGSEKERVHAASELSRSHIRAKGVRTRGSLDHAATGELSQDAMHIMQNALQDPSSAVRREVAFALGQWGDEEAVAILHELVVGDVEEEVRRAAINALGTIGGATAVKTLCEAAEKDPSEAIRYNALAVLNELALKNYPVLQEPSEPLETVRVNRLTVLPLGSEEGQVITTLQRISTKNNEEEYIRHIATAALNLFDSNAQMVKRTPSSRQK